VEDEAARGAWSAAAERRRAKASTLANNVGTTESLLLPGAAALVRRHEEAMWPLIEGLARAVAAPKMPFDEGVRTRSPSSSSSPRVRRLASGGTGTGIGTDEVKVVWAMEDQDGRDRAAEELKSNQAHKGITLAGIKSTALRLTLRLLLEYASESARATERGAQRPSFGTWLVEVFLPLEIAGAV